MQKMTIADIKALYPAYEPRQQKEGRDGKRIRTRATQKNHRHPVNPIWLPAVPGISPAEYRRRHLGAK